MKKRTMIAAFCISTMLALTTSAENKDYSFLDGLSVEELNAVKQEIDQRLIDLSDEDNESAETEENTSVAENEELDFSPATDFLYVANEGQTIIRAYNGKSDTVVIPNEIDGCAVTTIAEKAFEENEIIKKVVFPNSIREIGENAFHKCKNLTEIQFPSSMIPSIQIGDYAFSLCELTEPVIVYAENMNIGVHAFGYNSDLSKVMLLANDIVFRDAPFSSCSNITQIYMYPDTTTSYDGRYLNSDVGDAFAEMENLTELYLPSDCSFLTENSFVDSPRTVVYAEENAPVLSLANSLWIPTNYTDYASKSAEIISFLESKGYKRVIVLKDKETVQTVQSALNSLGYDCGTPDGVAGQKTTDAIIAYQTEKGIEPNGVITQDLVDMLIEDLQ